MKFVPAMPWRRRSARPAVAVRGAGFPSNAHRETVTRFGPHPLAVATVAAIDRTDGLGLRGASGRVRIGIGRQEHGYMHTRRVISPVGQTLNLRYRPNTALPGTAVPVDAQGPVMSLLARLPNPRGS